MEQTREYGIVFKIDWDQIVSLFTKKNVSKTKQDAPEKFVMERKANLKLLVVGREIKTYHYVDWYILVLGVGIGLRGSIVEK